MQTNPHYKLILADDHILLRDALANLIDNFEHFSVIARAANGAELIQLVKNGAAADIALIDLNMPVMDGYKTASWLAANCPKVKVVVLTMYDTEITLIRLLQTGVCGFLKKDINPEELNRALLCIAEGEYYYSNHITHKIASLFLKTPDTKSILEKIRLADSEIEFLKLASTDMTYKEIAQTMHMTPRNIDSYRDALFTKFGVESRVGLVICAVKNGIISF